MTCSHFPFLAVGTVAGIALLFSAEVRADVPEGPNQHCRDDAGAAWGDLETPYFWNTPATPQLTNGACPAPLAAACADKGIKYAHLGSTPQCGGKGWFCRIMDQPGWENKFYEDRNFEHCNVTDADEKDQGGHCHGSDTDSVYGWWIRDHWHRGYPGTLHCCCDWEAVKGVVNRCDYRKPIRTATEQQQCRDANEEHNDGFDGNCAKYEESHPFQEPAETTPDQCWTVTNFADPRSITKNTFNPPNYDDKQGSDFPTTGPSPTGGGSNPTSAPPPPSPTPSPSTPLPPPPPSPACVDTYNASNKPWEDFVSCAAEKEYCNENTLLQQYCAKTCETCTSSPGGGSNPPPAPPPPSPTPSPPSTPASDACDEGSYPVLSDNGKCVGSDEEITRLEDCETVRDEYEVTSKKVKSLNNSKRPIGCYFFKNRFWFNKGGKGRTSEKRKSVCCRPGSRSRNSLGVAALQSPDASASANPFGDDDEMALIGDDDDDENNGENGSSASVNGLVGVAVGAACVLQMLIG